jgi:hypothetical protein
MRLLRRILITVVITVAGILAGIYWIAPIALSFYTARAVPPVTRIVPAELKDHTVSQAAATRLSYLGYDFEVPWNDLDHSKTELYPKDKSEKRSVVCVFHSGLRLWLKVIPPREFADLWAVDFKTPPRTFDAIFGPGSARSDYVFLNNVYSFTPDKMHHWSLSQSLHVREEMVLIAKSMMLVKAADSGIFNLHNRTFTGFQQGDPQASRNTVVIDLYSGDDHVEMLFLQKDCHNPLGVTQAEINAVVQSLHRVAPRELASFEK